MKELYLNYKKSLIYYKFFESWFSKSKTKQKTYQLQCLEKKKLDQLILTQVFQNVLRTQISAVHTLGVEQQKRQLSPFVLVEIS